MGSGASVSFIGTWRDPLSGLQWETRERLSAYGVWTKVHGFYESMSLVLLCSPQASPGGPSRAPVGPVLLPMEEARHLPRHRPDSEHPAGCTGRHGLVASEVAGMWERRSRQLAPPVPTWHPRPDRQGQTLRFTLPVTKITVRFPKM